MSDDNKRIMGLYGEMAFAMRIHLEGWQVYRAYIDENVDFIIARYYCQKCKKFSSQEKRQKENRTGKKLSTTFPTNLCSDCKTDSLSFVCRFIQVKTSEGEKLKNMRKYSFHAKLRSNVDSRTFYTWIALKQKSRKNGFTPFFYIFHHSDINRFDNLNLRSYEKTDNQKIELRIDGKGNILNQGRKYNFSCFNSEFKDNFKVFDKIVPADGIQQKQT